MHNVLLKSVLGINSSQSMTLTVEHFRKENSAYLQSLLGPIAGGTRITRSAADDSSQRDRLGLAYRYTPGGHGLKTCRTNRCAAQPQQRIHRRGTPAAGRTACPAARKHTGTQRKAMVWQPATGWPAPAGRTDPPLGTGRRHAVQKLEVRNDALQRTVGSQVVSKIVDGDLYPRKIAPDTTVQNLGVFVQDEIALLHDRLRITPSLRFDTYRITPHPDALFANANVAGSKPVGQSKPHGRRAWA